MFKTSNFPDHSLGWARQLRRLASDCHNLLRAADVDTFEAEALLGRIDTLRPQVQADSHAPVLRWLENLREQVEMLTCLEDSTVGV